MKKIILTFLAILPMLISCVSRDRIEAELWQHEAIPEEVCKTNPSIKDYGMFRKVKCQPQNNPPNVCLNGEQFYEEFISYCKPAVKNYVSALSSKVVEWLNELTKPEQTGSK